MRNQTMNEDKEMRPGECFGCDKPIESGMLCAECREDMKGEKDD